MRTFVRIGLQTKIIGIVALPVIMLSLVFLFLYLQNSEKLTEARNKAVTVTNNIALQSTLSSLQPQMERQAMAILNTDELAEYLAAPDQAARQKLILDGIFLTLKEEHIIRYSLYNTSFQPIFQHTNDTKQRTHPPSAAVREVFATAAKDFLPHYYFRGAENEKQVIPTEYCICLAVSDLDDRIVGYLELAIASRLWLENTAQLTGTSMLLYDKTDNRITLASDPAMSALMTKEIDQAAISEEHKTISTDAMTLAVDSLPLVGAGKEPVGWLLAVSDATGIARAKTHRYMIAGGAFLLILCLSLGIAVYLTQKSIVQPIHKVIQFAAQLARGDVSETLEIKAKDETGQMASALNDMMHHIRSRSEQAQTIAEGNLTVEIAVNDEQDTLGKALRSITANLGGILISIRTNAFALNTTAATVAELSGNLQTSSTAIKTQAAELQSSLAMVLNRMEQVSNATDEMSLSIQEISRTGEETSRISKETRQHAENAAAVMNRLTNAVNSISQANQLITDFADQTNLLALNATIEAARAGEAGKGFAVVASEVKDLASQSMQTAKTVNNDIASIEQLTGQAVNATQQISVATDSATTATSTIASAVEEQAAMASDIAHNVASVFQRTTGCSKSLEGIDEAATGNSEAVAILNDFTRQLTAIAAELQQTVNRFHLV